MRKLQNLLLVSIAATTFWVSQPAMAEALPRPPQANVFRSDNYQWLRGAFPSASPADRETFVGLEKWIDQRQGKQTAATADALKALGVKSRQLETRCYDDETCSLGAIAVRTARTFSSWDEFKAAVAEALPLAQSYLWATHNAEEITKVDEDSPLRKRLENAIVGEQILRSGFIWGDGDQSTAPPLSPNGRRVMRMLLSKATIQRDKQNRDMLLALIKKNGWPTIAQAGKTGSEAAWLITQHADDDPVFQWKALKLMKPLVHSGAVDRNLFAFLYDRLMLKLRGFQRYGTQFGCVAGERKPMPLEDPRRVERFRRSVGLGSLTAYKQEMDKMLGASCNT